MRTVSSKMSRNAIEHPSLSPVREEESLPDYQVNLHSSLLNYCNSVKCKLCNANILTFFLYFICQIQPLKKKASFVANPYSYSIPMVDKAVIAGPKKDKADEKLALSKGLHNLFKYSYITKLMETEPQSSSLSCLSLYINPRYLVLH
jgi:hypothetical protein